MKLTVYFDPTVLTYDEEWGKIDLDNLLIAKKVNGKANAVLKLFKFQSHYDNEDQSKQEFEWGEKFSIGGETHLPSHGQYIRSTHFGTREIAMDQMLDFSESDSNPKVVPADAGFSKLFPAGQGWFGTKNQEVPFHNNIRCRTYHNDDYYGLYPIYVEEDPGSKNSIYRGFKVDSEIVLSWEKNFKHDPHSYLSSLLSSLSSPKVFPHGPKDTQKFVSWGYAGDNSTARWFDYGSQDPGKHDPSKGQ